MRPVVRVILLLSISIRPVALSSTNECPLSLQNVQIDNDQYWVSEETTSYPITKSCCDKQEGHSRLAILDSEVDGLSVMEKLVKRFSNRQFWVDAKINNAIKSFTWPNGSVVNESLWESKPYLNTTEDCVFIHTNGTLRRNLCSSGSFSVFCQAYRPPATTSVTTYACEHNDLTIACPSGQHINIVRAFYGQTLETVCTERSLSTDFHCSSTNASIVISSRCNGLQRCSFGVGNTFLFGDPCGGVFKYAEVVHTCIDNDNTSSLTSNPNIMPSITHSYQMELSTQEIPTQPAIYSSTINDFTTTATSLLDFTTVVKETTTMFETTSSPRTSTTSVQLENKSTTMIATMTPASIAVTMIEPKLTVLTPASIVVTMTEPKLTVLTPASIAVTMTEPKLTVSSPASTAVTKSETNLPISTPASTAVIMTEPKLSVSTPASTAVTMTEPKLPVSTLASTAVIMTEPKLPVSTPASTTVAMTEPKLPVSTKRYFCTCQMMKSLVNSSSEDNNQQIKKELYVNKASLSRNVRKRTSSKDGRPSAQTIGWLGMLILCVPLTLIVRLDLQRFLVHIQTR